jgi:hypothetical protein
MTISHLECQSFIKTIKNVILFKSTFPILPLKPLECKIFINISVLINVALLMKKIQDSNINSKKKWFFTLPKFYAIM